MKKEFNIPIKDTKKELMFEFLKKETPNLKKVLTIKLNEYDSNDGFIGEYYIVNCLVNTVIIDFPATSTTPIEKTCHVNKIEFDNWVNNKKAIKWI
jgi:hypothetical protein